jgi:hypothetical protein
MEEVETGLVLEAQPPNAATVATANASIFIMMTSSSPILGVTAQSSP